MYVAGLSTRVSAGQEAYVTTRNSTLYDLAENNELVNIDHSDSLLFILLKLHANPEYVCVYLSITSMIIVLSKERRM